MQYKLNFFDDNKLISAFETSLFPTLKTEKNFFAHFTFFLIITKPKKKLD